MLTGTVQADVFGLWAGCENTAVAAKRNAATPIDRGRTESLAPIRFKRPLLSFSGMFSSLLLCMNAELLPLDSAGWFMREIVKHGSYLGQCKKSGGKAIKFFWLRQYYVRSHAINRID